MKKIFIVTGDYSGDIHAGKVAEELKRLNPDLELEGVGGENLKNAGVKLFTTQQKMGAVGISPKILIDHLKLGEKVVHYIVNNYKPKSGHQNFILYSAAGLGKQTLEN